MNLCASELGGHMNLRILVLLPVLTLLGCQDQDNASGAQEPAVRGLKTVTIREQEETTTRRYPSVLQPADITTLSFETPGRIEQIDLKVGQRISSGEVVAKLDPRSLEIQVESSRAALSQAQAAVDNAVGDFERQEALFKEKVTTNAKLEQARANLDAARAQLDQSKKQLEGAEENLKKAILTAPFDGVVNSVEYEAFANVAAGSPVATIYSTDEFESSFSVSYDVNNRIAVGKKVQVRLADNPSVVIPGTISELGSRADTVSSYPIVVTLDKTIPEIKAGMAVEIAMELPIPLGEGFTLPLTALPMEGRLTQTGDANNVAETYVYVFDAADSTVKRRLIKIGGVRENKIIAVDGLEVGERVATAGVSFLRDGQKVKLIDSEE
ncbi:MAG: efflux RND transporter periplasmic adaptor subunit [Nitratireductor sp.]